MEEVPFSPENVFLELLRVGLAQAQEPQGAELAGELAGYSDLEASLEAGGLDLKRIAASMLALSGVKASPGHVV